MTALSFVVHDEALSLTAGVKKFTYRMPAGFVPAYASAELSGSAQTSGSQVTVDINRNGTSILSTRITIDNGDDSSIFAATQPVLVGTPGFAPFDKLTIDVDQIGDGTAKGLIVTLFDTIPDLPAAENPPPPPDPSPLTEQRVNATGKTYFGNLQVNTYTLSKAFDMADNVAGANCAAKQNGGGWIGVHFPTAVDFTKIRIHGRNDGGFVDGFDPAMTISVYTKVGIPANQSDGTLRGTLTFTDTGNEGAGRELVLNAGADFDSIWAVISHGTNGTTYCGELAVWAMLP